MTPLSQKQIDKEECLTRTIENAISVAFSKIQLTYELDVHRIAEVEELSKKLSLILAGNGKPENGLVFKVMQTQIEVVRLTELAKTRSAREWSLSLIGIGLIATSIWQIIAR